MADGTIADQVNGVQIASGDQVLVDRGGQDRRVPLATMGSWTPNVTFGGGSTGITYSSRVAQWTRIGDRIFFNISSVMTAKGSSTDAACASVYALLTRGLADAPAVIQQRKASRESLLGGGVPVSIRALPPSGIWQIPKHGSRPPSTPSVTAQWSLGT